MGIVINGVGSYIPTEIVTNLNFVDHQFLDMDGNPLPARNEEICEKFYSITGIRERRYMTENMQTSDMATIAGKQAIENANIDKETIDYIIVAHNFGNVNKGTIQSDIVPSLAARVKHDLRIENPDCVAYDILFGCPGWVEGVIQAQAFIKAKMAKRCLVIGAEALSRVIDRHDRDSMIYSDGAGATIIEESDTQNGILSFASQSHTLNEANYLFFGPSYKKSDDPDIRYIKMYGRKIYEFALSKVPIAMKKCVDNAGVDIKNVKKIFIHQANEKMDEAILSRFYKLYDMAMPHNIMPMSIHELGNSSVATIPTLLHLVQQNKLEYHSISEGDIILFASVGAGMNINAILYKV